MSKIEDLKANFSDFNRPNLYGVYISPKANFYNQGDRNLIGMLAHEATYPGFTFTTEGFWSNNVQTQFINKIDYDPITFSFYIDRDNNILKFFDAWKKQILDEYYRLRFYDEYISTIEIELMDRQLNTTAIATIIDAFPVNIEPIQLAYSQNDTVMSITVSFQFKKVDYFIVDTQAQPKSDLAMKTKSWKDYVTLENLRRGVNLVSKIKSYRRIVENPNAYDIVTNARRAWSKTGSNGTLFGSGNKSSSDGSSSHLIANASKAFNITRNISA